MGYGRSRDKPKGCLPVHSVETEEQAKALVVATCSLARPGVYYAPELAAAQTLDNLEAFARRLQDAEERFIATGHPAWRGR